MAAGHEYVALANFPLSPIAEDDTEALKQCQHHPTRKRKFDLACLYPFPLSFPTLTRARCLCFLFFLPLLLLPLLYQLVLFNVHPRAAPLHPTENPYFQVGSTRDHDDAVAARLDRCASLGLLRNTSLPLSLEDAYDPRDENDLIAQGCGTNETTVIILAALWFAEAYSGTSTTGETIYAQSVISTLNAYNYSYVFSSLGWGNNDMRRTVELWRRHRWNVRMVIADWEQIDTCWDLKEQECLKTEENLEGIEAWRLLALWYWDDPRNPLGAEFTLSPSPRNDNHFLSYSIEPTCLRLPFLTPDLRSHPPQAYLLAKNTNYLEDAPEFSWSLAFLTRLISELGIDIVAGMNNDNDEAKKNIDAAGIIDKGRLGKLEFYEELARSFVIVGVGRPRISPSPWDALCMGVPFINPILKWDEADPWNKTLWHAQHWHMTDLEPPYVYHVHAHDLPALRDAIRAALNTPIHSFIPDYMRFDFVCKRMAEVVEGDWKTVGRRILDDRIQSGEGRLFIM